MGQTCTTKRALFGLALALSLLLALWACKPRAGAPAPSPAIVDAGQEAPDWHPIWHDPPGATPHVVGASGPVWPFTVNGTDAGFSPNINLQPFTINGTDAGTFPALYFDGGAIGNINQGQIADLNSLVWGDVSQQEWTVIYPANIPTMQPAAAAAADGYLDAVLVNSSYTSVGFPLLAQQFTAPSNVSSVSFEVDTIQGPNGSKKFEIDLRDAGGITTLKSATCTPTNSYTTCTTGALSITPGTTYMAYMIWNNSGDSPSQAIIGRARVRVITGTNPLFAIGWTRFNASSSLLWDNGNFEIVNNTEATGNFWRYQSPMSRFIFDTNATLIGVNILNLLGTNGTYNPQSQTAIFVNGRPYTTVIGAVSGASALYDVQNVTLPGGMNRVEVVSSWGSYTAYSGIGAPAIPVYQYTENAFTLGVLVPQGSVFNVVPPQQTATSYIIVGDSKDTGYAATIPNVQGWPALLRRLMPSASIAIDAQAGASFKAIAKTPAAQAATIARFEHRKPTSLLFMHGRNDWADSPLGGADAGTQYWASVGAFQTAMGAFLDAVHVSLPSTSVFVVTPWLESVAQEAATNGNGETLAQYRTAMLAVCTVRQYCTGIDGTTVTGWNQTTDLYDNVHPSTQGSWKIAQWIFTLLDPPAVYGPPVGNLGQVWSTIDGGDGAGSNFAGWAAAGNTIEGGAAGTIYEMNASPAQNWCAPSGDWTINSSCVDTVTSAQGGQIGFTVTTGNILFSSAETAPGMSQTTESSVTKGTDTTISAQKSTHATDHGGGNVILNLDTPGGAGVESAIIGRRGATAGSETPFVAFGEYAGTYAGIWTGNAASTYGTATWTVLTDLGNTTGYFNGGNTESVFEVNYGQQLILEATGIEFFNAGTPDFGGGSGVLGIGVATTAPTALPSTGTALYTSTTGQFFGIDAKGITFPSGIVGPVIQQASINSSGTGVNTTLQGQSNLGTGGGGSLILASGAGGTTGPGVLNLNSGSTTVVALGGTNGVGLGAQNVFVTISSGANTTLTAAQATLPVIIINTLTLSGAGTIVTFPNVQGIWWVDISRLTLTNSIQFKAGTGVCGTVAALTTNDNVIEVLSEGSNTCIINL